MAPMTLSLRLASDMTARDLLRGAAAARAAGCGGVWLADNPLERSSPISAAAIATAEPGLDIGLGIVSARERHPVVLAQEVTALRSFTDGQVTVGLGVGFPAHRRRLGLPAGSGLDLLRDTTHTLRELTAGRAVPAYGDGDLEPISLKIPTAPLPVYIGGIGPKTLALAGEVADGVVLSLGTTTRAAHTAMTTARSASAGTSHVKGVCYVAFGGVGDGSADRLEAFAAHYLGAIASVPALAALLEGTGLDLDGARAAARAYQEGTALPPGVAASMGIAGSLDQCVERLSAYREAGIDEVALGLGAWNDDLTTTLTQASDLARAWTTSGAAA